MKAVALASLMAQRLILLQRKSDKPPSFNNWIREMLSVLQLETQYSHSRVDQAKFRVTRLPFTDHVKNLSPSCYKQCFSFFFCAILCKSGLWFCLQGNRLCSNFFKVLLSNSPDFLRVFQGSSLAALSLVSVRSLYPSIFRSQR